MNLLGDVIFNAACGCISLTCAKAVATGLRPSLDSMIERRGRTASLRLLDRNRRGRGQPVDAKLQQRIEVSIDEKRRPLHQRIEPAGPSESARRTALVGRPATFQRLMEGTQPASASGFSPV